jgi:ABC-2 type transport system ATP-binding protein
MAVTAQRVIVIGRGRLISNLSVQDLVASASGSSIRVRSPEAARLRDLLSSPEVIVSSSAEGALSVTGTTPEHVGDLARDHDIAIHELVVENATLEEAFMELTADAVEYHGQITGDDDPSSRRSAA